MPLSMGWLFVGLFASPVVGKQPNFFVESDSQPPAPATMNADFFEDPEPGAPLAPAPADSQESQLPTWGDYAAQQSVNAQLAERVAELTKAAHLLWREERVLRRRSHQQIVKLKQKCHMQPKVIHESVAPHDDQQTQKNLRQTPMLPVSLTHAAARHHRNNKVKSELNTDAVGTAVSVDQTPLIGTNVGSSMAAMYKMEGSPVPNPGQDGSHEAVNKRELEDELAASRARLGRNEEARLHLEDQIRHLEEKYQKGMRDAAQRQQDLTAALKRKRAKELELEEVKNAASGKGLPTSAALSNELGATMKIAHDRIEQEKQDLLTYRDQADMKLRTRKNEARNLQAKNVELRKQLQTEVEKEKKLQEELQAVQSTWTRLTGQVEALHNDEVEVSQEQQTEEQRLADENDKLHSQAEEERQCMDWGHRLDARLQHELQRKVSDAKLCRDSILSLHNERLELKSRSEKYKREIEEEKLHESEARRNYEENQQLLDHCLGQMTR